MAFLYFFDNTNALGWTDADAWFTDATHLIPAGATPTDGDSVTFCSDTGNPPVDAAPTLTLVDYNSSAISYDTDGTKTGSLTITGSLAIKSGDSWAGDASAVNNASLAGVVLVGGKLGNGCTCANILSNGRMGNSATVTAITSDGFGTVGNNSTLTAATGNNITFITGTGCTFTADDGQQCAGCFTGTGCTFNCGVDNSGDIGDGATFTNGQVFCGGADPTFSGTVTVTGGTWTGTGEWDSAGYQGGDSFDDSSASLDLSGITINARQNLSISDGLNNGITFGAVVIKTSGVTVSNNATGLLAGTLAVSSDIPSAGGVAGGVLGLGL